MPAPTPGRRGPIERRTGEFPRASAPPYYGGAPSRRTASWADFLQFVSVGRARIPRGGRRGRASRERRGGRPGRITLRRASGQAVPKTSRIGLLISSGIR